MVARYVSLPMAQGAVPEEMRSLRGDIGKAKSATICNSADRHSRNTTVRPGGDDLGWG
jgi:hypothetical protein